MARESCSAEVRGECAERMEALEQRIETMEETSARSLEGIWTFLRKVGDDVSYMRGRFDQMVSTPPPQPPAAAPPPPRRRARPIINLGIGAAGGAVIVEIVKLLLSRA